MIVCEVIVKFAVVMGRVILKFGVVMGRSKDVEL